VGWTQFYVFDVPLYLLSHLSSFSSASSSLLLQILVMKLQVSLTLFSVLLALPAAQAWGSMGHEAIAYIAQNFLTTATATYCKTVLGDSTTSYLANVATWADSYRYTTAGSFSAPFHYIDANDSPPAACSVSYTRDCGSAGCVVSAIKNYVRIALLPIFPSVSLQVRSMTNFTSRHHSSKTAIISMPLSSSST
jgi:hypothetical protein